jgi:hypothetical protein
LRTLFLFSFPTTSPNLSFSFIYQRDHRQRDYLLGE